MTRLEEKLAKALHALEFADTGQAHFAWLAMSKIQRQKWLLMAQTAVDTLQEEGWKWRPDE
jgi:hypothetical protein